MRNVFSVLATPLHGKDKNRAAPRRKTNIVFCFYKNKGMIITIQIVLLHTSNIKSMVCQYHNEQHALLYNVLRKIVLYIYIYMDIQTLSYLQVARISVSYFARPATKCSKTKSKKIKWLQRWLPFDIQTQILMHLLQALQRKTKYIDVSYFN